MAGLTNAQLESLLALVTRSPSGDNAQPWSFVWDGGQLRVRFDPNRARHVLDTGFSASAVALGTLIESVAIAATGQGLTIRCEFHGISDLQEADCARIEFVESGSPPSPWIAELARRTTDRRVFRRGTLPRRELDQVVDAFDRKNVVSGHFIENVPDDLLDYILAAECLVASHPAIFPDTVRWVRLSRREADQTQDGMPWQGTGVSHFEYPAMAVMRAFPRSFRLFSKLGMKNIHRQRVRKLIGSSAGLVCISACQSLEATAKTLEAPFEVGRLALRLWLELTRHGFGVQPLTLSSLQAYNVKQGRADAETIRLFGTRYERGFELLRERFSLPRGNQPVWMLRTGLSDPLPESWITPRLDIGKILNLTLQS